MDSDSRSHSHSGRSSDRERDSNKHDRSRKDSRDNDRSRQVLRRQERPRKRSRSRSYDRNDRAATRPRVDTVGICKFFDSSRGCRSGDQCKFKHVSGVKDTGSRPESSANSPRISSEPYVCPEGVHDVDLTKAPYICILCGMLMGY
jgi:hypothetical protein